mmetsp:Transcript_114572/g.365354  ORF Transcript_114572/g.365354 Transcript_114572/m.365354 type:complete len:391 (+) Transcript_114572:679-1851(+)
MLAPVGLALDVKAVTEGAEPEVVGDGAGPVVALEEAVVRVVELVALEVVLEAGVRGRRREEEVHAHPHERKGRGLQIQDGTGAGKVEQVLDGVHAEAREGLDVGVPVVEAVHIPVEELDVQEAVRKVEVQVPPQRHPEPRQHEEPKAPPGPERLLVGDVRQTARGVGVREQGFPEGPLQDGEGVVEHVVGDLRAAVLAHRVERPLSPTQQVERDVPEPDIAERDQAVRQEAACDPCPGPRLCGLQVVGEEEIVKEGNTQPHEVRRPEQETSGEPAPDVGVRPHLRLLRGRPRGPLQVHPERSPEEAAIHSARKTLEKSRLELPALGTAVPCRCCRAALHCHWRRRCCARFALPLQQRRCLCLGPASRRAQHGACRRLRRRHGSCARRSLS